MLSPAKLGRMSERFVELLEQEASERGWGPREAVARFSEAYPSTDPGRQRKLREVLSGMAEISASELELEMAAFAEMLRSIRGLRSFSPADLQAELMSAHRQS